VQKPFEYGWCGGGPHGRDICRTNTLDTQKLLGSMALLTALRVILKMFYTQVVFESPSMKLMADSNDFRCMRALTNICAGTLLLVEHCLDGNVNLVKNCIRTDPELYKNLYPRTATSLNPDDAVRKLKKNAFGSLAEDTCILGCRISNFNHKTLPNAYHQRIRCPLGKDSQQTTMFQVVAIEDICKDDEITISYGDYSEDSTHRSFMTDKDNVFEDFKTKHKICVSEDAKRVIEEYFEQPKSRELVVRQELARQGLYSTPEGVIPSHRWLQSNGVENESQFKSACWDCIVNIMIKL